MPSHELPVSDRHEELGHAGAGCPSETGERSASLRPSHRTRPSAPIGCLLRSRLRHLSTCQIRPAALDLSKVHEFTGEAHEWLEQEHEGTRTLRAIIRDPIAKDGFSPRWGRRGWTFPRPRGHTAEPQWSGFGGPRSCRPRPPPAEAERDPLGHPEARADPDQDPSGRAAGPG